MYIKISNKPMFEQIEECHYKTLSPDNGRTRRWYRMWIAKIWKKI